MPVSHAFVSAKPPAADPTQVGSAEWNALHVINVVNADVDPAAGIVESKLALNFPTHAAVTIGTANGLSLVGQTLSLGLASAGVTGALSGADWTTFNNKQSALTFPLASTLGGTGVNNAGTLTNASNTTITGGGTLALGGFTLTVPATGTVDLLDVAQTISATKTFTTQQIIDGTSDQIQLRVQGHSTQTNALQTWENSSGTVLAKMGNTGVFSFSFDGNGYATIFESSPGDLYIRARSATKNVVFDTALGFLFNSIAEMRDLRPQTTNTYGLGSSSRRWSAVFADGINAQWGVIISTAVYPAWHVRTEDTTTGAVRDVLRLESRVSTASTGGAAGFGPALTWYAETATDGTNQQQGLISTSWIDPTNATRKAKMSLSAYDTAARLGIEIEASGTAVKLGFFGVATVVRPTALTTQLTTITHTAPTPDYAIQNLTNTSPYGFVTQDEGNTVLSVIANLQTRVGELETKLQALGLLT
jgi:hypothetical protein